MVFAKLEALEWSMNDDLYEELLWWQQNQPIPRDILNINNALKVIINLLSNGGVVKIHERHTQETKKGVSKIANSLLILGVPNEI